MENQWRSDKTKIRSCGDLSHLEFFSYLVVGGSHPQPVQLNSSTPVQAGLVWRRES